MLLKEKVSQATAAHNAAAIAHTFQPKFVAEAVAPPLQHQHFVQQIEQGGWSLWPEVENAEMVAEPSEPTLFSPFMPSSFAFYDLARHASPSSKKHKASHATTMIPNPVGAACMHSPC